MRKNCLLLCLLFAGWSLSAQSFEDLVLEKARNAKEQGEYKEAVIQYDRLIEKNPQNPEYQFQKAMCYYRMEDYNTTIRLAEKLVDVYPLTSKYYRLLGNSYDLNGDYFTALEIFEMGNNNIEGNGELYLDLGVIEMIREDYLRALDFWEMGIEKAPSFPDNYYWAAKTYNRTNEKVWVLIYGEIFLSLEKSTDRFNEISQLVYDTYAELIYKDYQDYQIFLPRTKENQLFNYFTEAMAQVKREGGIPAPIQTNNSDGEVYLPGICKARKRFLEIWNSDYSNFVRVPLFEHHYDMVRRGLFEAYNHWLMINAEPKYFMSWQKLNTVKYQKFINWYISNPMRMNDQNCLVRMKYDIQ